MTSFFLSSTSSLARASRSSSSLLPARSFHFTSLARSTQGYGSPDVSNPTPKENNQTKFPIPQDKKSGDDSPQQTSGGDKDLPTANGDSKDSSGDQGKPHYVCDTEKSGAKGEEKLVKPEDKQ